MHQNSFPVVPSAWPYLFVFLILTIVAYVHHHIFWASTACLILILFAYFFRNPRRSIPAGDDMILSPADGVVKAVKKVDHDAYLGGPAIKVSIFLSLFNVHVNRSPVSGNVLFCSYKPGFFIPAFKSHASELNERNFVGIDSCTGMIIVTQITGFLARRIVCWVKPGDQLKQGQLLGLIKFGSCTEITVPCGAELLVKEGQKVKGGLTVIGRVKHEHVS